MKDKLTPGKWLDLYQDSWVAVTAISARELQLQEQLRETRNASTRAAALHLNIASLRDGVIPGPSTKWLCEAAEDGFRGVGRYALVNGVGETYETAYEIEGHCGTAGELLDFGIEAIGFHAVLPPLKFRRVPCDCCDSDS